MENLDKKIIDPEPGKYGNYYLYIGISLIIIGICISIYYMIAHHFFNSVTRDMWISLVFFMGAASCTWLGLQFINGFVIDKTRLIGLAFFLVTGFVSWIKFSYSVKAEAGKKH